MKRILVILLLFSTAPAFAQSNDPKFMQQAITVLQTQRNAAMDAATIAQANLATVRDELTTAQNKIKELEDKLNGKKSSDGKK